MLQQPTRSRRPSRATKPTNEENAGVPRPALAGKTTNAATSHIRRHSREKNTTVAAASGPPRRVLGDVSNATRSQSTAGDRLSKDAGKPTTRSRPASQSSIASVASTKPSSRPSSQQSIRPALASKYSSTSLREAAPAAAPRVRSISEDGPLVPPNAPRIGAYTDEEAGFANTADEEVEVLHHDATALRGLGIEVNPSDGMQVDESLLHLHDDDETTETSEDEAPVVVAATPVLGGASAPVVEEVEELEEDTDNWMGLSPRAARAAEDMIENVRSNFNEEVDFYDTTMVAEYSEEIFSYMGELEEASMPNPNYMEHQTEIEWAMRATLIDWLLQVHVRYHMLPETLWIAVNIIDRFLSNRVVSLVKLQLVGVTAMFIAAKYEEIMAPSVEEFVYMTENGYTREEILKGERIILQSLEFNVSSYCSPYSWVRRISKADDYDIQTRTLSKFLMEVTLLDYRFLRAKASMIAAIGMYVARRMLGGEWEEAFVYYSGYTAAELERPCEFLLENLVAPDFEDRFVYKKYANKKFLKAAIFARNWAKDHPIST